MVTSYFGLADTSCIHERCLNKYLDHRTCNNIYLVQPSITLKVYTFYLPCAFHMDYSACLLRKTSVIKETIRNPDYYS